MQEKSYDINKNIVIKGARVNNLKNIDLVLPLDFCNAINIPLYATNNKSII